MARYYEFEGFRVDVLRRTLWRDSRRVPLAPKVFDLLLSLLQNRDRVVNKSELMSALWLDAAVEEANLTQSVFLLRKALGENARSHNYIVTIPGRGYRFIAEVCESVQSEASAAVSNGGERRHALRSISVLPLRSLQGEPRDANLGLGIADSLTAVLGKIDALSVKPTWADFQHAQPKWEPLEVGRELKVDWILHGTLQRFQDRLRVVLQLVDVTSGMLLWADQLERDSSDIFAVEDAVSELVGRAIAMKLGLKQQVRGPVRHTKNNKAYQLYLKGRYFWGRRTAKNFRKAAACFDEASRIDPQYALASTGLADCYCLCACYNVMRPLDAWPRAWTAASRALEIDSGLPEAHATLCLVKMGLDWDWITAEENCVEAIRLNPEYTTALNYLAENLMARGYKERAIETIRRAAEIEPLSLILIRDVGTMLYYAGRYQEAVEQLKTTLELDPEFMLAHWSLGWALERAGEYDNALKHLRKALDLSGGAAGILSQIGFTQASAGQASQARETLEELTTLARRQYVSPYDVAILQLGLGNRDQAFESFRRAADERVWSVAYLKVDPRLDLLRSDSRFSELLHVVGFER